MPHRNHAKRTEKIQLMLDDNELAAIDDWRFEHRLPSRAAAIRELIRRGLLKSSEFSEPPSDAASGEFRVIDDDEDGGSGPILTADPAGARLKNSADSDPD